MNIAVSHDRKGIKFGSDCNTSHPTPELTTYNIKLGWIQGVLIPCLLNIWGVMLFLRISWIVSQAGIALSLVIIALSGVVCVITTLSLCALCTNGDVEGGGVYYLVSRSLGAELGASVGLMFAFANSVAASMNTIGFCDSLNELLRANVVKIVDNSANDVRIIGTTALLVMCIVCAIGMDWETKTQVLNFLPNMYNIGLAIIIYLQTIQHLRLHSIDLLILITYLSPFAKAMNHYKNMLIVIIVLAIVNFVIGACKGPSTDLDRAQGFIGISQETAERNWKPDFRYSEGEHHNFFSVFAIYFPAVTGVQAGANICGDLKDPKTAIPKGTLSALAISLTSYVIMAVLCGVAALRDASGDPESLETIDACKPDCEYGLHNNYEIMKLMAMIGFLNYLGCWAATLSTALTNLLSVPRLIQALGKDRIYPGLIFFSKPYGRHGEPYRGYVLTFLVSVLFLLIADLNTIAPLITNFYLGSYALINFCTFHAEFVKHISWRPTFRCYHKWLSLLGFTMCLTIMVIISWVMALVTLLIFLTLYMIVVYRKPDVDWGSSTEAQRYRAIVTQLLDMSHRPTAIKSYNPQPLVLTRRPSARPKLLEMAHLITKIDSFMIVAEIDDVKLSHKERCTRHYVEDEWLRENKYRSFYVIVDGLDFEHGVKALLQTAGLGRLSPNMLMIGFKHDWLKVTHEEIRTYVRVIQHAFEAQVAVTILRTLDPAPPIKERITKDHTMETINGTVTPTHQMLGVMSANSDISDIDVETGSVVIDHDETKENITFKRQQEDTHVSECTPSMLMTITTPSSQVRGLDAWWLYDDGGLNILLPYIITQRGFNEKMPLRIFALGKQHHSMDDSQKYMETLLDKYRIKYASLTMLCGLFDSPSESSWELFNSIIQPFRTVASSDTLITESELKRLHKKTSRYLKLREMLLDNSSLATFIVITLPVPRKDLISAALYMSWLEVLSRDLPPILFVRGNDTSVLAT